MKEIITIVFLGFHILKTRKKGELAISKLGAWLILVIALIIFIILMRGWADRGSSMNPFRR